MERYRAWADECRLTATGSPLSRIASGTVLAIYAFFHFPLPEGWSEAKKQEHYGKLHRSRSDVDNCLKAVSDSLFEDDQAVPIMHGVKLWCEENAGPRTDVFLLVA